MRHSPPVVAPVAKHCRSSRSLDQNFTLTSFLRTGEGILRSNMHVVGPTPCLSRDSGYYRILQASSETSMQPWLAVALVCKWGGCEPLGRLGKFRTSSCNQKVCSSGLASSGDGLQFCLCAGSVASYTQSYSSEHSNGWRSSKRLPMLLTYLVSV